MLSRLFHRITANEETSKHATSSKSLDFGKLENMLQDPCAKPMSLPLDFMKAITRDFSDDQELGRGGYGVVYKGVLGNGKSIAVKKLNDMHLDDAQFHNEVTYLIRLKHQNVVQLVGYCAESRWEATQVNGNYVMAEKRSRMLCFEYLNKKSLDKHLSAESCGLEWHIRFEIIRGICCGLHYLHTKHIVHLDLKPENILLDDNMVPKIADFGMSRLFGQQQSRMVTQNRGGTLGYMAPEYLANGLITTKSDIFSAGVIIIELMTGSKSYPQNSEELFESFIENVVGNWRKRLEKANQNVLFETNGPQVDTCIRIGLKCIDPDLKKRPTAKDLVEILSAVLPPFTNVSEVTYSTKKVSEVTYSTKKVSEVTTILGTSSTVGTLGSSFASLNASSGFFAWSAPKGSKICMLAFEVANTIVRGCNVMRSVSKPSIKYLKEVVLRSEGVQNLISKDIDELLKIAATDIREELKVFTKEVARFGNYCKDPQWHNLDLYFDSRLAWERITQHPQKKDAQSVMHQLIIYAQCTSELYHELLALDIFEKDYHRKQIEQDGSTSKGDSLHLLKQELKSQIKHVKIVRKKSLWCKNLEEMMEKFIDIVHFLHLEMHNAFGCADTEEPQELDERHNRLGPAGLSLHYANIINLIDTIVSQPSAISPDTRDTLYCGLPCTIKSTLRSNLCSFKFKEELTATNIKAEMEKILRWLVPFANNTLKAHHGFGWVGEWANTGSQMDYKLPGQIGFTRIETLYHAEKMTTEAHILELVILLHHLISKSKYANGGIRSPVSSTTHQGTTVTLLPGERNNSSPVVSREDQDIQRDVKYREFIPATSKNQEFDTNPRHSKQSRFSKSNSHSPASGNRKDLLSVRKFSKFPGIDFEIDRTKALDLIDGIEDLKIY